ncbi:hypothetical protein ACWGIN_31645 [Streptomyces sp. NPDC054861]
MYGSSAVARGGSFFRGSGQAEFTAFRTVRYVAPYLRSRARIDVPARWSRRIAAYSSTFDICGMTSTFHQEHPDAAPGKNHSAVKTREHHPTVDRGASQTREQLLSLPVNKARHVTTEHTLAAWARTRPGVARVRLEQWTEDRDRRADAEVLLEDGTKSARPHR